MENAHNDLFEEKYFAQLRDVLGQENALPLFEKMLFYLKEKLAALDEAFAQKDMVMIEQVIHALGSNAAQMGAMALMRDARRLEQLCQNNTSSAQREVLAAQAGLFMLAEQSLRFCEDFINQQKSQSA